MPIPLPKQLNDQTTSMKLHPSPGIMVTVEGAIMAVTMEAIGDTIEEMTRVVIMVSDCFLSIFSLLSLFYYFCKGYMILITVFNRWSSS